MAPEPSRILLIRPSALGDVCRTVPVLASLKARWPEARIDWLVQEGFEAAIRAHPALDRAIPFPRRRLSRVRLLRPAWWRTLGELVSTLRAGGYDLVLDCQGLSRSGLLSFATGAPRRVGYANAREFAWVCYTERAGSPRDRHAVDRMLDLAEQAGAPRVPDLTLHTCDDDRAELDPRLAGARYAVVAPTSRWEGKRWPADRFARVVEAMLGDGSVDAVGVVASAGEADQCEPVRALAARDDRVVDLVGATSVGGLMATIERAAVVLANDSAALHMAAGFGRPLVGLFGPTRIDAVGPYGRDRDVLQPDAPGPGVTHKNAAAGRAMMERIAVADVLSSVTERLSGSAAPAVYDPG